MIVGAAMGRSGSMDSVARTDRFRASLQRAIWFPPTIRMMNSPVKKGADMNGNEHDRMEPNNERYGEFSSERGPEQQPTVTEAIYAQAGYSFPMGPVIPSPDARWQPLWRGLEAEGLNRPKAAAQVMLNFYSVQDPLSNGDHEVWRGTKGSLTGKLDLAFRNYAKRVGVLGDESEPKPDGALEVLDRWLTGLNRPSLLITEMFKEKLRPDLINLYSKGRNNARNRTTPFGPPDYPTVDEFSDANIQREVVGIQWEEIWKKRYGDETKTYVREVLLTKPAGEWNVLTLLFVKLLNTHMALLVPKYVQTPTKNVFYRPLIGQLRQCAIRAGENDAHPLADIAVGILQTLPRLNLLLSSGKKTDEDFPEHPEDLDPKNELLPDSLHLDAPYPLTSCIEEVKAIFLWMENNQTQGEYGWKSIISWIDDVAKLAWEFASARTDPFAFGGLGLVRHRKDSLTGETIAYVKELDFRRYRNSWDDTCKPVRVILRNGVDESSQGKIERIPPRFKKLIKEVDRGDELRGFVLRNRELVEYYQLFLILLNYCGLNEFQSSGA